MYEQNSIPTQGRGLLPLLRSPKVNIFPWLLTIVAFSAWWAGGTSQSGIRATELRILDVPDVVYLDPGKDCIVRHYANPLLKYGSMLNFNDRMIAEAREEGMTVISLMHTPSGHAIVTMAREE